MVVDIGEGTGKVFVGSIPVGTIDEGEGVQTLLGDFEGVGERVVHGSHEDMTASGIADGKGKPPSCPPLGG